ncbi:MAG: hypothetical protein J6Q22_04130 [Prevotella sp.]|nr:hypothetical protein [Prevotella sp.]
MKRIFLLVATAAMFAACSQTEELASLDKNKDASQEAVGFDVYAPITRAGTAGEITTASLKTGDHKDAGFGVFGYYSDNEQYSVYLKPNFMYNQQVLWDGNIWKYEPAKYWPNEFGTDATSEDVDYLSFFAYAPYVKFIPSSGAVDVSKVVLNANDHTGVAMDTQEKVDAEIEFLQKKNIIGTIRNTSTGDPMIKYAVDWNPATSVDLLWGVAPTNVSYSTIDNNSTSVDPGKPYINMLKMKNGEKVKFLLCHALAWLNVQIDADFNSEGTGGANGTVHGTNNDFTDRHTKIWIRSITFDGFAAQGSLNLNNESTTTLGSATVGLAKWMDISGANELETGSVTIYDGRKDGGEGVESNEATSEKPHTLNPQLIQTKQYLSSSNPYAAGGTLEEGDHHTGVTKTPQNLFESTNATDQIYVIPTSEKVNVTIVYDVETADENLATYLSDGLTRGSSIQNRISKLDVFSAKLEAGKKYTLKLHLGMTDVKFDAEVQEWETGLDADSNLPFNH